MKKIIMTLAILSSPLAAMAADLSNGADNFYKSDKVTAQKVTFKNQYKLTVTGNLFIPKNLNQKTKNPAIIVGRGDKSEAQYEPEVIIMRATVMYEAGDVRIENVPDPKIVEPTDAIIRVTRACICGSDLWPYQKLKREEILDATFARSNAATWSSCPSRSQTARANSATKDFTPNGRSRRSSGWLSRDERTSRH